MTLGLVSGGGALSGWMMLKRAGATQRQIVARDPMIARNSQYFRENIGKIKSADDLVKDHRLLGVTLGAFGLEADIANKAFIRKILESDRDDSKSMVNRLTDKRYAKLVDALKLDEGTGTVASKSFGDSVVAAFQDREFERRIGETQPDLRLAMNAQRELSAMAQRTSSDKTLWYEVMGNAPLRKVFDTAFGFGPQYGRLPIDRQLQEYMSRAEKVMGSSSFKAIATPEGSEKLIRTFLVRSQLTSGTPAQNSYSAAQMLLARR